MTEQEWLACTDPSSMLESLRGKTSKRKLRLLACACTRRVWEAVWASGKHESERSTVQEVEMFAEDPSEATKLAGIRENASLELELLACEDAAGAAWWATNELPMALLDWRSGAVSQVLLLQDIFGNPFRPQSIEASWLTWLDATIPKFAQAIYTDRSFDRMPILADALEDAGCHDTDILAHCRQPGSHVRGCWVVDLLLGKE